VHACRKEWLVKNPISLVRQSGQREKIPAVLEVRELKNLLSQLENPTRLIVFFNLGDGIAHL
jgi:site-specific recombinase XerD